MASRTKDEFLEYAGGDQAFATWLEAVDESFMEKTGGLGLGIFDMADYNWRDSFDGDIDPSDAADDFIESEGIPVDDDAPSEDLDAIEEEEDGDDDDDEETDLEE